MIGYEDCFWEVSAFYLSHFRWVILPALQNIYSIIMQLIAHKSFTRISQDALAVYANQVIQLMSENPQFSHLKAEIDALKKSYDAFFIALVNIVNGGRIATLEKENRKKDLLKQMNTVATLVDFQAQGDESIILAAGFDVHKTRKSCTGLPAPNVLKIVNETEKGLVTIQLEKVANVLVYGIEKRIKTEEPTESTWINGDYTSASRTQLRGLESGKTYQFQVRAVGKGGLVSAWSAMQEVFVS